MIPADSLDSSPKHHHPEMHLPFFRIIHLVAILILLCIPIRMYPFDDGISGSSVSITGIKGDVDGNGVVDMSDARLVAQYIVKQISQLPHPENADANSDGVISLEDAFLIAQHVSGKTTIVVVSSEHGMPGKMNAGSLVRIEVFEHFFPHNITGGTVRITSTVRHYDSGIRSLTFNKDGRSLYYHWDTRGLSPDSTYEVSVTLTGANGKVSREELLDPNEPLSVTLTYPVYELPYLAQSVDAHTPAPGFAMEFKRVVPQDHNNPPYLGPLGYGWMHNFDIHLEEFTDGRIAFLTGTGFNRWFTSNGNGTYSSSPGDYGKLYRETGGTFVIKEKDGLLYRFRTDLKLDFIQDVNKNKITAVYNSSGLLTNVQHSSGIMFTFEYNMQNRISKLTDNIGRQTVYNYDPSGNYLLSVVDFGGRTTTYTYNYGMYAVLYVVPVGQSVHPAWCRLRSVVKPGGEQVNYTYDNEGRISTQEGYWGTNRLVWTYDNDGTTHITNAVGGVVTVQTNENRQPIAMTNPLGAVTQYQYDDNYNLTQTTDPLGHTSTLSYDAMGNVIQSMDAIGNSLHFTYETKYNKILGLTDSRGNTTSFAYDTSGNLKTITYPNGSTERFVYDAHGLLLSKTDRKGQVIEYTYDSWGLLLAKTYPDGGTTRYTYNTAGRMLSALNSSDTIYYSYDASDRLLTTTYSGNRIIEYEYNNADQRTKMTDPDGKIINYNYDDAGRLTRMTDSSGATLVEYLYDAMMRRIKKILANGVYTTYTYDGANQVLNLVNYNPQDSIISRYDYTYDAIGNRKSKHSLDGTETYLYDALNQLFSVTYPGGSTSQFIYDQMGNRTNVIENGTPTLYTANNLNQYLSVGSATYSYDGNGNMISKTDSGKTTYYEYDYENRLIRVRTPLDTISYKYDGIGNRSKCIDGHDIVRYLNDGIQTLLEENDSHQTLARFLWGDRVDEAIQMQRNGGLYYYAEDALSSVTDLFNDKGNILEHYRYTAFGDPLLISNLGNPWLFTGREYNSKTCLQYNCSRFYSPQLGRFISPDPINILGGTHLYSYTENKPINFIDPLAFWIETVGTPVLYPVAVQWPGTESWMLVGPVVWALTPTWVKITVFVVLPVLIIHALLNKNPDENYGDGGGMDSKRTPDGGNSGGHGPDGGSSGGGSSGGGVCPTFIQSPVNDNMVVSQTSYINKKESNLKAKIVVPVNNALLRSDIPIFGIASGKNFKEYRVEYGEGKSPTQWHTIETSAQPQENTTVDARQIEYMQGDIDIRGNLATWNTGLKSWVHLPWHPQEETIDFNGVYTIRLVVKGTEGDSVEDRVTCEVGNVIAQCLPGKATSPDKKVTMRFPEQSLTYPFRIYTILPLEVLGEETPQPSKASAYIGSVYRVREAGDRFIKNVSLEFSLRPDELKKYNSQQIGICQYNRETNSWAWLVTVQDEQRSTFSTILTELPALEAIYALAYDSIATHSTIMKSEPLSNELKHDAVAPGILIDNTFENHFGTFKPRDRFVGSILSRDNTVTTDGSYCLKLTNENYGGNFSCTVLDEPFDVREYSVMSFDYCIGQDVKIDFMAKVHGRWYNLRFTNDAIDFRNRDVNIANLGEIPDVMTDNKWHTANIDLGYLLKQQTCDTQIEEIIMADWKVGGYMKLEFGSNARSATFYLDNFKILGTGHAIDVPSSLVVDDFEAMKSTNKLNGQTGSYCNPGSRYCEATRIGFPDHRGKNMLHLTFDMTKTDAYGGYWTSIKNNNISDYSVIRFKIKSENKIPPTQIGIRDMRGIESTTLISSYISPPDKNGWSECLLPISALSGSTDLYNPDVLFLSFGHFIGSGKGSIDIDDIILDHTSYGNVNDFESSATRNLLGGIDTTYQYGAAVISSSLMSDRSEDVTPRNTIRRISYGGSIGKDYGTDGGFSFCYWQTELHGIDARRFKYIAIKIKGEKGGEIPNFYLSDNSKRICLRCKDMKRIADNWEEFYLQLSYFNDRGIDLSHLNSLQIAFEWSEQTGTIYIDDIRLTQESRITVTQGNK